MGLEKSYHQLRLKYSPSPLSLYSTWKFLKSYLLAKLCVHSRTVSEEILLKSKALGVKKPLLASQPNWWLSFLFKSSSPDSEYHKMHSWIFFCQFEMKEQKERIGTNHFTCFSSSSLENNNVLGHSQTPKSCGIVIVAIISSVLPTFQHHDTNILWNSAYNIYNNPV
jgi:hypothetical protein